MHLDRLKKTVRSLRVSSQSWYFRHINESTACMMVSHIPFFVSVELSYIDC